MFVRIRNTNVTTETVQKGDRKGQEFHKQTAELVKGDYGQPFEVGIDAGKPYQPGLYVITAESFYPGKYGRLELGRIHLAPLSEAMAAATAAQKKAA